MEFNRKTIKDHIHNHLVLYSIGGAIVVAGITTCVVRGVASQSDSRDIVVTANRAIGVVGKKVVMRNVSYISSDRQGPPSWVVRCKETGEIFTSQRSAAMSMGLSDSHISQHLNGVREHVNGNTFERICMAA